MLAITLNGCFLMREYNYPRKKSHSYGEAHSTRPNRLVTACKISIPSWYALKIAIRSNSSNYLTSVKNQVRPLLLRYPKPPRRRRRPLRRRKADQQSRRCRNRSGYTAAPNRRGRPQPRRGTLRSYRFDDRSQTRRYLCPQRVRSFTRESKIGEF